MKIRIGIVGYGNVGKGVEHAVLQNSDMELIAIFTRRNLSDIKPFSSAIVDSLENIRNYMGKIDVIILCNGSANDTPVQGPQIASMFCTVDSYDNHAQLPNYFNAMNTSATNSKNVSLIATGWDPGLFSINRALFEACLPNGTTNYFYGPGVSQGHSEAIRNISGVKKAIQYTMPVTENLEKIQNGEILKLSPREKYTRLCYVVAEDNADRGVIEKTIKEMPDYFDEYDTTVNYISEEEFDSEHFGMPHGGVVIRIGFTGKDDNREIMEFSLKLAKNPEFSGSILVAYARATARMHANGEFGAKTVFDVPPVLLSNRTSEELIKFLL
jgi:diaminopimelate dehydrogenase